MGKSIFIVLITCGMLIGCIDAPTETKPADGEELKIMLTSKASAIYTITPYGNIKFDKVEAAVANDSTEIKTILYLHRINSDSVSIVISKDSKRILGRINNSGNVILKEFILDNGAETRIIKF